MAYNMTDFLEEFAHISNVVAILVVVTCLACMMVYIYRINIEMERQQEELRALQQIPAQIMGQVYNPFVLQLQHPHTASMKDGVRLQVTSQVPCVLKAMWGVTISHIYPLIHAPWRMFVDGFDPDFLHPMLSGQVLHYDAMQHFPSHTDSMEVVLQPPRNFELGPTPRDKYPLVVVVLDEGMIQGNQPGNQPGTSEQSVVCMVSLFHVRDEVCPGESHLLAQYVRTTHAQSVYNLQQVYMTGEADDSDPTASARHHNNAPSPSPPSPTLCIICQTDQVNRVVLPCRHACVCDSCFERLDRCPMCRGVISAYFTMDGSYNTSRDSDYSNQDGR